MRVGDKLEDTGALGELVLADMHMDGVEPVTLSDVADITVTDNSNETYARINGNPGLMVTMQKQSGYSTGEVSERIGEKFREIQREQRVHISSL